MSVQLCQSNNFNAELFFYDTANYSGNGNIVRKSDFGLYAYSGSKPHAVSGISSLIAATGEERTCEAEYNTIG